MAGAIEACTLQKDAIDVDSIVRRGGELRRCIRDVIHGAMRKAQQVDLFAVLPREVLHGSSEEGLREENAADPKAWWRFPQIKPHLEEPHTFQDVQVPSAQGLQGEGALLRPHLRHFVDEERLSSRLQLRRHHDETFDGLPEILQGGRHGPQQLVVSQAFLLHHGIHGLVIPRGEFGFTNIQRERFGQAVLNRCGRIVHDRISRATLATAGVQGDHALHAREQFQGFVLGAGDVAILVQTKCLRHRIERQAFDVCDKILDGLSRWSVVQATGGILVAFLLLHRFGADEGLQDGRDQQLVFVVRHTAAVVDLGTQEV
mmetsp:Transcript_69179/g.152703  ORF Transcript_69179/g.152703 Transcript_69179/m.152703 type:complete len:316 (-) Transcript_69179:1469-2416(-)